MGTMGLGWTDNWAVTASTDSQGNVTINASGSLRSFTLQSDGSYLGTWGDNGTLTALPGGGYQLQELDGSLTVFNTNGTLKYVQDTNGNRITASYSNGLLARLTASNGAYLSFSYTNGLLTSATDSTGESTTYSLRCDRPIPAEQHQRVRHHDVQLRQRTGSGRPERAGLDHLRRQHARLLRLRRRGPADRHAPRQQPTET